MASTLRERMEAPDGNTEDREIWETMRTWLVLIRIAIVVLTIFTAELFEEHTLKNFSISIWAVIIGIPLFILISMVIVQGDKRFAPDFEERRKKSMASMAVKRPIRKRE
ncbi:MAG: hypothetical protein QGI21_04625 [Candidatus Poseidoniaceae archaeon]|jgi:Na+/H+ antiporter NhaC|nr:hypothetical protein [Candidatus Poseidoniaceae archaeon]